MVSYYIYHIKKCYIVPFMFGALLYAFYIFFNKITLAWKY